MLFETEFKMAVALAIPCFVRFVCLAAGGMGEPLTGDRDGWRVLPAFKEEEGASYRGNK
jgi:hypothetical protein